MITEARAKELEQLATTCIILVQVLVETLNEKGIISKEDFYANYDGLGFIVRAGVDKRKGKKVNRS